MRDEPRKRAGERYWLNPKLYYIPLLIMALLFYVTSVRAAYVLALAVVALVMQTMVSRGKIQNYFLSLTTLTAAFLVIEILASVLEARHRVETFVDDGFYAPRLVVGWAPGHPGKYRASKRVDGSKIFDVIYTIDDDLNRRTVAENVGKAISIFGDSTI